MFNIHGEGGVGKTTLLQQWRTIVADRGGVVGYSDEHVVGVAETLEVLATSLGTDVTKEFRRRFERYLRGREALERDPQAPREQWQHVVRTSVKAGLAGASLVPGAGLVTPFIDPDGIARSSTETIAQVRQFLHGKLRNRADVGLMLSPAAELTPLLITALRKIPATRPVVWMFDTYERTGEFLDLWLRQLFAGELGDLPANLTLVVCGRSPLDVNQWATQLNSVEPVSLAPFTDAEARQLIANRGITDAHATDVILNLSGRLPLLVDMLARQHPVDGTAVGDPTGTAVDRFLKWEFDPSRRAAALAGALPRRVNQDLLSTALGEDADAGLFDWLTRQPFVSATATSGYQYHDVVREPMLRHLRQRSVEQWQAAHARLADRYRGWCTGPSAWNDAAWRDHHVEATYHDLCADPLRIAAIAADGIDAADSTPAAARRWTDAIGAAAHDTADAELSRISTRLSEGWDAVSTNCRQLLMALIDTGCLNPSATARAYAARAYILYRADEDEAAIIECSRALAHDPTQARAYAIRAAASHWLSRYDAALADFDRAIALDSDDSWAIARRGQTYCATEQYEEALADYNRAIALDGNDGWAVAGRGQVYRRLQRYDEALADFDRAVALDGDDAWAVSERGQTYHFISRQNDALADFDRVIALDPKDGFAFACRGAAYRELGRYEDALASFEQAMVLDDSVPWVIAGRGDTFRMLGRLEQALADLDRAVALDNDYAWALASRGRVYYDIERFREALEDCDRAIALDPNYAWATVTRGLIHRATDRYEEALTDLNHAMTLDSTFSWVIAHRGETYRLMGRHEQALADLDRAIALDPDDAQATASRGLTNRAMGRYEEALTDFDRAMTLDDSFSWLVASRGEAYRLMNRNEEALADFDRAIALDGQDAWSIGRRGRVYRAMLRYDDALADFDRTIELDDQQPWIIAERGRAYRLLGRFDEALTDLDRAIAIDGDYSWAIGLRGETHRLMQRYEQALADFGRAITLDERDAWLIACRGHTYSCMGRHQDAVADLRRAVELYDEYGWAFAALARITYTSGDTDEAVQLAWRVIRLPKAESDDLCTAASVLYRAGDPEWPAALERVREAAANEQRSLPRSVLPVLVLAVCDAVGGDVPGAVKRAAPVLADALTDQLEWLSTEIDELASWSGELAAALAPLRGNYAE